MSDEAPLTATEPLTASFSSPGQGSAPVAAPEADASGAPSTRPELVLAGAFVGGFLFAKLLRRRGD